MLNLLDLFKKTVKTSIEDKTLPSSISRFNVGQRIKDLADQTMRVPLLQVLPNVFYPLGFKGRDADFNEYIAITDNVNGDYNDSAKWKPSGGGNGVIDDGLVSLDRTWSSQKINGKNFRQLSCNTIAVANQDLYTQTIQGINALNSLFTAQTNFEDNGFYGWNGSYWTKSIGILGYPNEYEFLSHCIFTAFEGTEVGKGYLLDNGSGPYHFVAIGGGSLAQASQAQVEASFDNTNQTTPVVLEQTSALTPFNAWWLVQKMKEVFAITQEFDLPFDGVEDTFTVTHGLNNDKALHYTVKTGGSLRQNPDDLLFSVSSNATTLTVQFVVPPSAGTGYLTVTGLQKEAITPLGFTADSTTITSDSTLLTVDEL